MILRNGEILVMRGMVLKWGGEGGGDTPLQTMFINKDLLEYRFAIL